MELFKTVTVRLTIAASIVAISTTLQHQSHAAEIDLSRAVVVVPDGLSPPENKAVQLLVEEVRARSGMSWDTLIRWPGESVPVIAIGPAWLLRSENSPIRRLL